MNSRIAIVVSTPACAIVSDGICATLLNMSPKLSEPNVQNASRMPTVKAKSPRRVVMKAFFPAADRRLLQEPEADQQIAAQAHAFPPTNITIRFAASTSVSMKNMNRFR